MQKNAAPSDHESDPLVAVVALLLEVVALFARLAGLNLDELLELSTDAYFKEYRGRGLSVAQIAVRFDKSERTVASIKKRAESQNPLAKSVRLEVRRKIVMDLSRGGATTEQQLRPRTSVKAKVFSVELQRLLDERRVEVVQTTEVKKTRGGKAMLALTSPVVRLQREDLAARLDAVRHFLGALKQTLYQRFFSQTVEAIAVARVLTFPSSRDGLATLANDTVRELMERAQRADQSSSAVGITDKVEASVALCVVEAPNERAFQLPEE